MTTYNLDKQKNDISAGNGTDFFQGAAGGADILRGNGGSDFFSIQRGQTGLIDGGSGYDRLHLTGPDFNNELDSALQVSGVEELIVDATNLYATAAQLKGISHFGINNDSDEFYFFLQGAGGKLDFSKSYSDPQKLNVEAEMVTSAVSITGSAGGDQLIGSDFNDRLYGDRGADTIYGGSGNDLVNGGTGKDTLYGDDGKDTFVFDTALRSNVDHLGDFRPKDDTIRLDDAIFDWAGQETGTLAKSAFKVIGSGQTVDSNDHILFNSKTGVVYFDADGSGSTKAVAFAVADNFAGDVPALTYQDFIIA